MSGSSLPGAPESKPGMALLKEEMRTLGAAGGRLRCSGRAWASKSPYAADVGAGVRWRLRS